MDQTEREARKLEELVNKQRRVKELVKMGRTNLILANADLPFLGMKNVQFKKIFEEAPERNVTRTTEEIAELIYYKELENKK